MKQIRHLLSILIIVMVAVLAAGTFVERFHGSAFALSRVYSAWWFVGLWALMAVFMVWMAVKHHLWKSFTVCALHLSILLILLGALLTMLTGQHGRMLLRPGEATQKFYVGNETENHPVELPFTLTLDYFEVVNYPETHKPKDFVSHIVIGDTSGEEEFTISMNHILRRQHYRFYQSDYDEEGNSILEVSRDPWGIAITYTGYALLFVALVAMLFKQPKTYRAVTVSWLSVLIILAMVLHIRMLTHQLLPVLRSPFFSLHISTIVTSYVLLFAIMVVGIIAIMKPKDQARLEKLKSLSTAMLYPAVALLAIGIFIGAVWANVSWGNYWSWDPKEVWALITLLIYAAPLHEKIWKSFQKPLFYHVYGILAILSVLITYFGVNMLLGGIHAYS